MIVSRRQSPDFICIGPEKTGTTLLYSLLQEHPEVALPPVKELRYWDEGFNIPEHTLAQVVTSEHWHYSALRRRFLKSIKPEIKRLITLRWKEPTDFYWRLYYTFGKRGFCWYEKQFSSRALTGDISPLYYHLPEERIKDIYDYRPETKILIFIRDPIERAWSKIKMNLLTHRNREIEDLGVEEFNRYSEAVKRKWVPYLQTVKLWEKYFPGVYVSLFDDLKADQFKWYLELCNHLNISPTKMSKKPERKVNVGKKVDMPESFHEILKAQYWNEMVALNNHYPHLNWLDKYSV